MSFVFVASPEPLTEGERRGAAQRIRGVRAPLNWDRRGYFEWLSTHSVRCGSLLAVGNATLFEQRVNEEPAASDSGSERDLEELTRAFAVSGERFPEKVNGEFGFVIANERTGEVTLIRDHLGVLPLYYSSSNGRIVVSDQLDSVRALLERPDALDERAVLDFLMFGFNLDQKTTTFADIERVAPATVLTISAGRQHSYGYWRLPDEPVVERRSPGDYVAEFRRVFEASVLSRVPRDRVAVSLSGGLDSTSVAAVARQHVQELSAVSVVFETLFSDPEPHYMKAAATKLQLNALSVEAGAMVQRESWSEHRWPEPLDDPTPLIFLTQLRVASRIADVMLTGHGGDPVLYTSHSYYFDFLRRGRLLRLAREIAAYVMQFHAVPPLLFRSRLLRAAGFRQAAPPFPSWLRPELVRKWDLPARWKAFYQTPCHLHRERNQAYDLLRSPAWTRMFELNHRGSTGVPIELRHPFLDVRLISSLLATPAMPWFSNKHILREAMNGILPDEVRLRPKTHFQFDTTRSLYLDNRMRWLSDTASSELYDYVDRAAFTAVLQKEEVTVRDAYQRTVPFCLAAWMQQRSPFGEEGATG